MRFLLLSAALLAALPAVAQDADDPRRIVVAEIENEAIRPLLTVPEVEQLVRPEFDGAAAREGQRPQFEQSRIVRGSGFHLEVDAQFADGNDFLIALPLEEVHEGGKRLLVLVRRSG